MKKEQIIKVITSAPCAIVKTTYRETPNGVMIPLSVIKKLWNKVQKYKSNAKNS